MSRAVVGVVLVCLFAGLVLFGYDILILGMALPTALALLHSHWREMASDLVTMGMDNKGWAAVFLAGIVLLVFIARLPKKY